MATIQGQRTTESVPSGLRPLNFSDKIFNPEFGYSDGDDSLFRLLYKLGKGLGKETKTKKFQCAEDVDRKKSTAISSISGATDTYFDVTSGDGDILQAGMMLYNEMTDERMRITDVSGDTVTVTRDWGSVLSGASSSTANNDVLRILGLASAEGTDAPDAITNQPSTGYNYLSFVRTAVEASEHDIHTTTEYGNDWDYARKKQARQHVREVNSTLWFSSRHEETTCPVFGKPVSTTGGVFQHLGDYYDLTTAYSGVLTEKAIDLIMERAFYNGSDDKVLFCGRHMGNAFTSIAKNKVMFNDQKSKSYGMKITEYTSGGKRLEIITEKEIFEGFGATNSTYGGTMSAQAAILDVKLMGLRHIPNMGTRLKRNVQLPGVSGRKDVWETTIGLEMSPTIDFTYNSDSAALQYRPPHLRLKGFVTYG